MRLLASLKGLSSNCLLPYNSKINQSEAYKYEQISIRCERFMQSWNWSDRGVMLKMLY